MPHIFKVEPYRHHIQRGKAKIGDVVYLTCRPDIPMTVCETPFCNRAADVISKVHVRWFKPDGTTATDKFDAGELSL